MLTADSYPGGARRTLGPTPPSLIADDADRLATSDGRQSAPVCQVDEALRLGSLGGHELIALGGHTVDEFPEGVGELLHPFAFEHGDDILVFDARLR